MKIKFKKGVTLSEKGMKSIFGRIKKPKQIKKKYPGKKTYLA